MRSPIEEIPRGVRGHTWVVILFFCCEMTEEAELQRIVQTMVEKALEEERARTTSRLQSSSGRSIPPPL